MLAGLTEEGWLDGDSIAGPTTLEAALLAAGCALEAAEAGGFALVRPPGHHALPDRAMGFCFVGNVAVAARHAQDALGRARVAIVDWDVHHGNGTEAIFRGDDSVLFVSIHQWPFYPGTGGPGTSDESTLNVPLAAGSGDAEYLAAFTELVEPVRPRVRPRPRSRLGGLRRPRGRSARPHGAHGARVRGACPPLGAARATGGRRARRRL